MCMSPDEMTSVQIEESIAYFKEMLQGEQDKWYRDTYEWRLNEFELLLKERAENGTYDTAGYRPGHRHETQRTAYQGV